MIFRVAHIAALTSVLVALTSSASAHTGHGHAGGCLVSCIRPAGSIMCSS